MSQANTEQQADLRLPSGIPGLDRILEGGFLEGGVYIVAGAPGAGKTILANQVSFHQVAQGKRVAYVTLLAESHSRMLTHLRSLSYFDPTVVSDRLSYLSAFRTLEENGLNGLLELLRREIRAQKASLLVIDGLVQAEESASTRRDFKKFIHELQVFAHLTRCTTLLLTSGGLEDVAPEHTMVDGVIHLKDETFELRRIRELEVRKFRGSGFLRGRHSFKITPDGLKIYPRLETLASEEMPESPQGDPRLGFGVEGLDAMLGGGLPAVSSTLLSGTVGSGKTMLALQFLAEGARRGERGLYFGFYESPPLLLRKAARIGLDLARAAEQGLVHFEWQTQVERQADALAERLLTTLETTGAKRLVVDGMDAVVNAIPHPNRIEHFFAALTQILRLRQVTALFTHESPNLVGPELTVPIGSGVSAAAENLVFLRQVELGSELRRLVCIFKVRDTDFDRSLRELTISGDGIRVGERMPRAEAQLTGEARGYTTGERGPGQVR